jgi:hypothetical protein
MATPATPSHTTQDATAPIVPTNTNQSSSNQTLKGLKLFILLGSITLVTFLALIDTSIIGTVSFSISAYKIFTP